MNLATIRFRSAVAIAVLTTATLFLPSPAEAGGPTSALLSVPGGGQTASLYYTDPEYDALASMLGADIGDGTSMADTSGRSHATGPGVTVTWLIHDVTPWRVDHIYLLGEGAPWVGTQLSDESGNIWNSPVIWHKPASPAKLVTLLDQLGVGEISNDQSTFDGVAGAPLSTNPEPATESDAAPAAASPLTGIGWGVGGVAVGVLLTVMFMRARRPDPESEPKAETVPTVPADDGAGATGFTVPEELSWPAQRT